MRRLMAAAGTTALLGLAAIPAHAGTISTSPGQTARTFARHVAQALPEDVVRLNTFIDLQSHPSGAWVGLLAVTLPQPGTYILDANVHGRLWGRPPVNALIQARLWNVTTNALVSGSTRTVDHLADQNRENHQIGQRATAPISEEITVGGPTTIRLEATRINQAGASTFADIISGERAGWTTLRATRV